jgi:MFS transporter, PAT family, beta-lactamase induction signal transducer AmpG
MPREHDNPAWLFGILTVPTGVGYWGVNGVLIPYLLRQHGVSVDRIAGVVAIASIPGVWFFLASPFVDLGLKRRTWILLSCVCSAVATGLAILRSAGSLEWVTALLFTAIALGGVATAAIGAVMTTIRPETRGQASGWTQVGNVGAGALAGGAGVWMASFCGLPVLASAAAAVMLIPALAALWIVETPHPRTPPRRLFAELGRDLWGLLWSWRTAVGLLFFLSPVGAGAVAGLISSVGPDYHAPNAEVAWVTGAGGGFLLAMGSLMGGFVCDRMHRMTAYAIFGILTGAADVWLMLGPATPFTYGAGYAAYALAAGLSFASFIALILEVLGNGRRAAATGYALLFSSGNLPLTYMTWLDGAGYKRAGARGLMGVDAMANLGGGVALLLIAHYCARRWQTQPLVAEVQTAV